ncbi:pimeloyl-ACP methyl ester carboxylesterase [Nonomuraea thailandensis]|uniref:Pimeloyl-ACP methyl ester carboxylesterase n=1 Tax=Nonomuraea thailandensis TaxID=1188745 RepID=A0A9X2GNC9_9ACTN|nr:alpha/beta hydrolase [Nonomuraea thailandensis]MCP2362414.1 pimeloyl-ACP methyl ester carboxylesterase [Nonomuraea thailandensis]
MSGDLIVPDAAAGMVVFVHGSGSSRHSPRNRYVAGALNEAGLGTLLFDLLTPEEEADRANVFDIALLADRLLERTAWVRGQPEAKGLPIGYFGASTGAAAALWAAAEPDNAIAAIVSRGGRPDLAGDRLAAVRAPTLLVVGGRDPVVVELNEEARRRLRAESRITVVPGATHLFEEPGALEAVAGHARDWFTTHFSAPREPM